MLRIRGAEPNPHSETTTRFPISITSLTGVKVKVKYKVRMNIEFYLEVYQRSKSLHGLSRQVYLLLL